MAHPVPPPLGMEESPRLASAWAPWEKLQAHRGWAVGDGSVEGRQRLQSSLLSTRPPTFRPAGSQEAPRKPGPESGQRAAGGTEGKGRVGWQQNASHRELGSSPWLQPKPEQAALCGLPPAPPRGPQARAGRVSISLALSVGSHTGSGASKGSAPITAIHCSHLNGKKPPDFCRIARQACVQGVLDQPLHMASLPFLPTAAPHDSSCFPCFPPS